MTTAWFGAHAIWASCLLLLVSFVLMFIREDLEENPQIEQELGEIRRDAAEIDRTLKQELREEHEEWKESMEPHRKTEIR